MTKFEVTLWGQFVVTPEYDGENYDHDDVVDRTFNRTVQELLKYDGVEDPQISGTITTGEFEVSILVDAASYGEAVSFAEPTIRSAFHGADVNTDDWESVPFEVLVHCVKAEADDEHIEAANQEADLIDA